MPISTLRDGAVRLAHVMDGIIPVNVAEQITGT